MQTRSRPPRVLVVYQHLPHYRRAVFTALQRAADLDIVFASDDKSVEGNIVLIPPCELPDHILLRSFWAGRLLWQHGLAKQALFGHYDAFVFLGDWRYLSTWLAAGIARMRKKRVMFWTIGWHYPERGARRYVRLTFYHLAHSLLLYGEHAKALGVSSGYPEDRMIVVGNSASDESFGSPSEVTSIDGLVPDRPFILTVIRLNANKRLDMLIQAVSEIESERRPAVVLVGVGPERERLRRAADEAGVALLSPGAIHNSALLAELYERASVAVIPEAAGLTTIQSLSHGVPVITCDDPNRQMPEFEAIVHGSNGSLYESDNVSALAAEIETWICRSAADRPAVRTICRASINGRWTVEGHSRNILHAIRSELQRARGD